MNKKWIGIFVMGLYSVMYAEVKQEISRITIFIHGTHRTAHVLGQIPGVGAYVDHQEGLCRPEECNERYVYRKIAKTISHYCPEQFPAQHFYIYSWSGILSHQARVAAAQKLHEELNALVLKYGKKCVITLITHSHGGNVALNLASVMSPREYEIDSLILLAVPVQHATSSYVDNDLFKNVFSLYSRWDLFQVGDPQGFGHVRRRVRRTFTRQGQEHGDLEEAIPFFSQRLFSSKKVKQIEMRHTTLFGNRPIDHIEFLLPHFTRHIEAILKKTAEYDFSQGIHMVFNLEKMSLLESLFGQ